MFSIEGTGGGRVGEAAIMQFEALRPVYGVGDWFSSGVSHRGDGKDRKPAYSGRLWGTGGNPRTAADSGVQAETHAQQQVLGRRRKPVGVRNTGGTGAIRGQNSCTAG